MKKTLGQYYTTNYKYILQNFHIPDGITHIIEPFAGSGELIKYIESYNEKLKFVIEAYDIDPKCENVKYLDTFNDEIIYKDKFVITNPPYLARNKSKDKLIFDKYNENDLYKCFIKQLLINKPIGGILIIPLNFFSSIRKSDIELRQQFIEAFQILNLNIFEEQVFTDTTYTICSFDFINKSLKNKLINLIIYPTKVKLNLELNLDNNYTFGGEIYNLKTNMKYSITRLTNKNLDNENITNILAKCIDDNNNQTIGLIFSDKPYIDTTQNQSARTYATLIITPKIELIKQQELIQRFNEFLTKYREKYCSLFLTHYRENIRKRISFDLVYKIIGHLLLDY